MFIVIPIKNQSIKILKQAREIEEYPSSFKTKKEPKFLEKWMSTSLEAGGSSASVALSRVGGIAGLVATIQSSAENPIPGAHHTSGKTTSQPASPCFLLLPLPPFLLTLFPCHSPDDLTTASGGETSAADVHPRPRKVEGLNGIFLEEEEDEASVGVAELPGAKAEKRSEETESFELLGSMGEEEEDEEEGGGGGLDGW